jgi:hypothetical protein
MGDFLQAGVFHGHADYVRARDGLGYTGTFSLAAKRQSLLINGNHLALNGARLSVNQLYFGGRGKPRQLVPTRFLTQRRFN